MSKSTSLVELHSDTHRAAHPAKTRRRQPAAPASGAKPVLAESTALKPLLIGVGIGAALVGSALFARSKKSPMAAFSGAHSALAGSLSQTALVALARIVAGQTVRTVTTTALIEVANALKG